MSRFDILETWAFCTYVLIFFACEVWYKILHFDRRFDGLVFLKACKNLVWFCRAEFIVSHQRQETGSTRGINLRRCGISS